MAEDSRNARRELRVGWAKGRELQLQERDLAILHAVGLMRLARTSDLIALFFRSIAPGRDRLRRLFVAGYLDCHAPEVASENLYALTRRGRDAVLAEYDVDPSTLACVRELPARHTHLALINRARVLLTLACRAADARYRLDSFRPEWQLSGEGCSAVFGILPDAIARLTGPESRSVHIAIEADAATENPHVVASKLRRYEYYRSASQPMYGVDVAYVLVLAPGVRRLRSLARAIDAMAPSAHVRFGDARTLTPADVFGGGFVRGEDLIASD